MGDEGADVGRSESMIEYWKSSAFVLNFMDGAYKLKVDLNAAAEEPIRRAAVAKGLSASPTLSFPFERYDAYEAIKLQNGRLRSLAKDTVGRGAHRLLWIPPSCPYYALAGAFAGEAVKGFTKRLVFSSWRFVPRAIASLLSYEAERLMVGRTGEGLNTADSRKRRARRLIFSRSDNGGPGAMSTLALLYPSSFLARACDPVHLAAECLSEKSTPELAEVLEAVVTQIELALRRLPLEKLEGLSTSAGIGRRRCCSMPRWSQPRLGCGSNKPTWPKSGRLHVTTTSRHPAPKVRAMAACGTFTLRVPVRSPCPGLSSVVARPTWHRFWLSWRSGRRA